MPLAGCERWVWAAGAVAVYFAGQGSCQDTGSEIPSIPIPIQHSYKPQDGPVFESWATERGLSHRDVPQPENLAGPGATSFSWKPIPDEPEPPTQNFRTTLRTRLRNHKKENAPPGECPRKRLCAAGHACCLLTRYASSCSTLGRWMHSLVVHDAQIYTFGGVINAQTLLNDVWGYDYAQEAWHELESPSNPLLHHPMNSEAESDVLKRKHHFHPPGSPPEPSFRHTPANAIAKSSAFRRQNFDRMEGDEMQVISVPSLVVQPPLGVQPVSLSNKYAHFDSGTQVRAIIVGCIVCLSVSSARSTILLPMPAVVLGTAGVVTRSTCKTGSAEAARYVIARGRCCHRRQRRRNTICGNGPVWAKRENVRDEFPRNSGARHGAGSGPTRKSGGEPVVV